ncbi:unnamed protein product [Prorocentrum cordatum]|uniref:RanBP2-type domain-containing protein n=1 Tax=Prorocentrum cordatum TaxID=2364126 RepID=A0ABN9SMF8_9DINO|nr:unnamed protein product [Polarella glacialis]
MREPAGHRGARSKRPRARVTLRMESARRLLQRQHSGEGVMANRASWSPPGPAWICGSCTVRKLSDRVDCRQCGSPQPEPPPEKQDRATRRSRSSPSERPPKARGKGRESNDKARGKGRDPMLALRGTSKGKNSQMSEAKHINEKEKDPQEKDKIDEHRSAKDILHIRPTLLQEARQ